MPKWKQRLTMGRKPIMIDPWLIDAIRANDVSRCILAIEFGADVMATKLSGLNSLHLAAIHKSRAVFDFLMESCGWMERQQDRFVPWSWQEEKRRKHNIPYIVRRANRRVDAGLANYEQRIFSSMRRLPSIASGAEIHHN